MYLCDRCQKGMQVGMKVSHSHIRTKKRSIPNLHVLTLKVDGRRKTMRLCTKCVRIMRAAYPRIIEEKPAEKSEAKVEKKTPEKEVKEETETQEVVSQEA